MSPRADMIGGDHLLRGNDRIEQGRMHGAEHCDVLSRDESHAGPGCRAGLLAITPPILPPATSRIRSGATLSVTAGAGSRREE
jgi:hypothetical protein